MTPLKKTILFSLSLLITFLGLVSPSQAADKNYITPIFPVRGREYWRQSKDITEVTKISNLVTKYNLPSTWLLHYDILSDREVLTNLPITNPQSTEIGLFLEVTRKLAEDSFVRYDWEHGNWSQANKVFLSGYSREDRQKMIDKAFIAFKSEFGFYPESYGAWYVDVWSMEYIRDAYGANVVLGLADQYSTDGYQTWGQYFNLPYFVSVESAIEPAESKEGSTGILKLQWAQRHPLLAYGPTVDFSNYSTQVNDYHRQKRLGHEFFIKLLSDLTVNVKSQISQATIGIEVGEIENEYTPELSAQLDTVKQFSSMENLKVLTMSQLNQEYRKISSHVSPSAVISSQSGRETMTWYLNPLMRYAIKDSWGKKYLVDLRYYHTTPYRDNDQLMKDIHPNLVRVAPAVIDEVVSGNSQEINSESDVQSLYSLPITQPTYPRDLYGEYIGKWVEAKELWIKILSYLPDVIYSDIEGQRYIGIRTDTEKMTGVRYPNLQIGDFDFKFNILNNFISLKSNLTPNMVWKGKQEIELEPHKIKGLVWEKGWKYGQDEINNRPDGQVVYENSYYQVISP